MTLIDMPQTNSKNNATKDEQNATLEKWRLYGSYFGYTLVSEEYIDCFTLLKWTNPNGRQFEQSTIQIRANRHKNNKHSGFTINPAYSLCQKKTNDEHYAELQFIAEYRGGKIISTEYISSKIKLNFMDIAGNIFSSTPDQIKQGRWSPYDGNISENICRQVFEYIFKVKFPTRNDIVKRHNKKIYSWMVIMKML